VTAEVVARQPIHDDETLGWATGAGTRYQFSPRWALDAGVGYELTGDARPWSITFGGAYAFGLPWRNR
jgi:opacity protein-like surface antigen